MERKNFIYRNDPFVCLHCGAENPLGEGEIRNHCTKCLFSLHVDKNVPGDRLNACFGLMTPIGLFKDSKKGYMIQFECEKCRARKVNKVAKDDNYDLMLKLSTYGAEI